MSQTKRKIDNSHTDNNLTTGKGSQAHVIPLIVIINTQFKMILVLEQLIMKFNYKYGTGEKTLDRL